MKNLMSSNALWTDKQTDQMKFVLYAHWSDKIMKEINLFSIVKK